MSTSQKSNGKPGPPTPDDLAGIPVCLDEEAGTQAKSAKPATSASHAKTTPTPDDLAGVMACPDGAEEITIRPRRQ